MVAIYKLEQTPCGHEGVIRPVLKKGGKCEGKWQCVVSGPIPTANNQKSKTLYCDPNVEAARQRIAKYLKTQFYLIMLTPTGATVKPTTQSATTPPSTPRTAAAAPVTPNEPQTDLEVKLRALRTKLARQEHMSPFVIFDNKTLNDLIEKKPMDLEHLVQVRGIKKVKAQKYGEAILNVMRQYA